MNDVFVRWNKSDRDESVGYFYELVEKSSGRIKNRRCRCAMDWEWIENLIGKGDWRGLSSVNMVECERVAKSASSLRMRYYISRLRVDAKSMLDSARSHRRIAHSMRWALNTGYREDESLVRKVNSRGHLSILRGMVMDLLRQDKSGKVGIETKRKRASRDYKHILKTLYH